MYEEKEPVKNPKLVAELKNILENHSQITSVNPHASADFEVRIADYNLPVYFTIQTQTKKMPEIGYYELYVFHGSPSLVDAEKMSVYAGKSVSNTVNDFFKSFNN